MAKLTQTAVIKNHLENIGDISGRDALDLYGIYRLSEVIGKLRRKGYVINTTMKKGHNRFGEYEYGVYSWGIQKDEIVPFMEVSE